MWKTIDGYFYNYRINELANIEREVAPNEWRPLKPFLQRENGRPNCRSRLCVRFKTTDGKWKNVIVKNLMVDAFFGGRKPGEVYIHRNGSVQDCTVYNLVKGTQKDVGERTGGASRRSVEKVDKYGQVVALYPSTLEAAKANYMSRKAIWMRCTNKVRDPFKLNGYTYRYEERTYRKRKEKNDANN